MEHETTLLEALEPRLHRRNRSFVHARYEPGRCPHCTLTENLQAMIRAKITLKGSSPKAVESS